VWATMSDMTCAQVLQVSKYCSPSDACQEGALMVIAVIVMRFPEGVRQFEADCVEAAVRVLRNTPPHSSANTALRILGCLLDRASASLGRTFIKAGGPDLLLEHVRSESCRNPGLMTVLNISCNSEKLADVVDVLAMRALPGDLPKLCEDYPPVGDAAARTKLLSRFKKAFGRPPNW
jgi:hypothetical protein